MNGFAEVYRCFLNGFAGCAVEVSAAKGPEALLGFSKGFADTGLLPCGMHGGGVLTEESCCTDFWRKGFTKPALVLGAIESQGFAAVETLAPPIPDVDEALCDDQGLLRLLK